MTKQERRRVNIAYWLVCLMVLIGTFWGFLAGFNEGFSLGQDDMFWGISRMGDEMTFFPSIQTAINKTSEENTPCNIRYSSYYKVAVRTKLKMKWRGK